MDNGADNRAHKPDWELWGFVTCRWTVLLWAPASTQPFQRLGGLWCWLFLHITSLGCRDYIHSSRVQTSAYYTPTDSHSFVLQNDSSVGNLLVLVCFLFSLLQWTALFSTEDWPGHVFPPISEFSHVLNLQKSRITGSHPLHSWSLWDIYCTSEFHSPFSSAWLSCSCENGCERFCSRCCWRRNFMWITQLVQQKN